MALGDAAHQLEGAEGVVALAAEFSQYRAVLLFGNLRHSLRSVALGPAVGVDKEYRLTLGQVLPGKGGHRFLKVKAVDAGAKPMQS